MGTPNALLEINKLSQIEGLIPGVGSVIDAKTAQAAIEAGAQFIGHSVSKPEVIQMAHQYEKPILSGADPFRNFTSLRMGDRCGQTFSSCQFWAVPHQSR